MTAAPAQAELLSYYVGIDKLTTIVGGTYNGLANPNHNHLTFLYAHTYTPPTNNHYHSKGILRYTGPNLGANTAIERNPNDYVPEGQLPSINLSGGTGIYNGKLVSNPYTTPSDPVYHFSFLTMGTTDSLNGFDAGTGETILFNSSSGRWNGAAAPAHLHFKLVSLTPGLNLGDATNLNIANVGDEYHLTDPGDFLDFTPVFWTNANAPLGNYEAVLRFFDEDGTFGDSGDIRFKVAVVPEPASFATIGLGALALLKRRRRVGS